MNNHRRFIVLWCSFVFGVIFLFGLTLSVQGEVNAPRDLTPIRVTLPVPVMVVSDPAVVFRFNPFPDMNGTADGSGYTYNLTVKQVGSSFVYKEKIDPSSCGVSCIQSPTGAAWKLDDGAIYEWQLKAKSGGVNFAASDKHYFGTNLLPEIAQTSPLPNQRIATNYAPPVSFGLYWSQGPYDTMRLIVKNSSGAKIYDSKMQPASTFCTAGSCIYPMTIDMPSGTLGVFSWQVTGSRAMVNGKGASHVRQFFVAGGY